MKKFFVFLFMVAAVLAATTTRAFAQEDKHMIVKNDTIMTVYTLTTYVSGETEITTRTYNGTDLATLKSLGIPEEAWPLFANNTNLLFSTETFVLEQQKKEVEANLEVANEDLDWYASQAGGYKVAFWFVLIGSTLVIFILSVSLSGERKKQKKQSA